MLSPARVTIGTDPEVFLEKAGKIIGSERAIPEEGLRPNSYSNPSVIRDGIQVELNPKGKDSIFLLGAEISGAFRLLRSHLVGSGVSISFRELVEVDREELDALSANSRILGCQPSKNIFGKRPITVDPKTYTKRSAGGHLHFGLRKVPALFENRTDLVALFAIFVGNTCVLIDRDEGGRRATRELW